MEMESTTSLLEHQELIPLPLIIQGRYSRYSWEEQGIRSQQTISSELILIRLVLIYPMGTDLANQ